MGVSHMKYYILTLIFISCSVHGMELKRHVGLSALLNTKIQGSTTNFLSSHNETHVLEYGAQLITKQEEAILYDIQHADITTLKLSAMKEATRFEIFDALCSAIAYGEKSPIPARIVRRGMMIFGAEGYHAALIRSLEEKNINLLKGLCSDSYSHMVRIAWQQDSDDYSDAFTTLQNNRAWILENNLQSAIANLFDSKTLEVQAQKIKCAARFSFWRKHLPAQTVALKPYDEENLEQITDAEPQAPHPFSSSVEESEDSESYSQKKAPLLMWLDRQIERIGKNWRIVTACCAAGAWFSWHYSAQK